MRRHLSSALAGFLGLTLVVGACSSSTDDPTATPSPSSPKPSGPGSTTGRPIAGRGVVQLFGSALQSFEDCNALLGWIKDEATQRVTAYGLPGYGGYGSGGVLESRAAAGDATASAPVAASPAVVADQASGPPTTLDSGAGVDFSGTNVQEKGVDEADLVKTDGTRLVTVIDGELHVLDVSGASPKELGSLRLPVGYNHELFLSGNRALVLAAANSGDVVSSSGEQQGQGIPSYGGSVVTVLIDVDLTDPSEPTVQRTLAVDGQYLAARLVGQSARVVLSSFPTSLVFESPQSNGLRAEREALQHNQQVIADSTLDDWLPYSILEEGKDTTEGTLLDCGQVAHPEEFSGFGTLTVLTVDLANGLTPDNGFGLFADGQTVYASTDHLVVATNPWSPGIVPLPATAGPAIQTDVAPGAPASAPDEPAELHTNLHMFDISDPTSTSYVGSGSVRGTLLNQWAMSEHDGVLRVASTTQPFNTGCCIAVPSRPVGDVAPAVPESLITVLKPDNGSLVQIGQVGGLGRGEQIYAVRMIGDIGYVVTFRRTDPLYTVDLSDPTNPTVVGELEIPGYSAYLHPVGDGLLVGIGQDAGDDGRVTGAQISLFDVSDPANPRRLDQLSLDSQGSTVEYDHRAFLYWAPTGLAVLPVTSYGGLIDSSGKVIDDAFFGAVGVRVDLASRTLETVGRISQQDDSSGFDGRAQIVRSLVVGDHVFTVAANGVKQSDLTTLADQGLTEF